MELKLYQIDAFTDRPFSGNPAAICPLTAWLPDSVMQLIAAENNLSETAFFVPDSDDYQIRWFTPLAEVDLCGHATLASAWVVFHYLEPDSEKVVFHSRSGPLPVSRQGDWLELDFPSQPGTPVEPPPVLLQALGVPVKQCLRSEDYIVVLENEAALRQLEPSMSLLRQLDGRGVIVTTAGQTDDFVCRFFAPGYGIDEDPVTGSAYTQLVPYWADVLQKTAFTARQLSSRGGELTCQLSGNRVKIRGQAVEYLVGTLKLSQQLIDAATRE